MSERGDELYRKVFDEGPIGTAVLDTQFVLVRANQALCRLLSYSETELTGLKNADLVHPEDRELDAEQAKRLLNGEIPGYQVEKRYISRRGAVIRVSASFSAIRDAQGGLQYLVAAFEEIS